MPGLSIFRELGAATSVILGKIRLVDSGGTEITEATGHTVKATLQASDGTDIGNVDIASIATGSNVIGKVHDYFGGNVYSKTMTMSDDNATRFETSAKKLRDVVIIVTTNNMLLGETGVEVYPVGAEEIVGFTKVDISTLYFKNASAGSNGTITILGVEE